MDIGKLAVLLTGNAQPLMGTLSLAQSAVQGWAASTVQAVNGLVAPAFTNTAHAIQKAMTDTFASLKGGVGKFLSGFLDVNVKRIAAQMQLGMLGLEIVKQLGSVFAQHFGMAGPGLMAGMKAWWADLKAQWAPVAREFWELFGKWVGPVVERGKAALGALGAFGLSVGKFVGGTLGSVVHLATTVGLGVAGVGVAVVKDFIGAFAGGVEDLVRTDIAARQLGVDVLTLRAAMHWAGPAASEMGQAMGHLSEKMVQAQLGNRQALRDFAAIGGTGGGLLGVLDAIASIPDPTMRAAQAFKLLGDSAGPLLDQLRPGAAGNAKGIMARLGLGAGAGDLAAARQVSQALRDLQALGAGAFNQVLLGVTPIVAQLNKEFGNWKVSLQFIRPLVIDIAEGVAKFGVFIGVAASNGKVLSDSMSYVWKQVERGWLNLQALMMDGLAQIADSFKSILPSVGAGDKAALKRLGLDADTQAAALLRIGALKAKMGAAQAGDDAGSLWGSIFGDVSKSPAWKGVTDFFGRVRGLAGQTGDVIKDAMGAKVAAALTKSYEGMATSLQRPADVFAQSMTQLGMMGKLGVGDPTTRALLAQKAGMDLLGAAGMGGDVRMAGAAEAQTREAYSVLARQENEGKRGSLVEQVKAGLDLLARLNQRRVEQGDDLLREISGMAKDTGKVADAVGTGGGAF